MIDSDNLKFKCILNSKIHQVQRFFKFQQHSLIIYQLIFYSISLQYKYFINCRYFVMSGINWKKEIKSIVFLGILFCFPKLLFDLIKKTFECFPFINHQYHN